jgi:hypothetical protein
MLDQSSDVRTVSSKRRTQHPPFGTVRRGRTERSRPTALAPASTELQSSSNHIPSSDIALPKPVCRPKIKITGEGTKRRIDPKDGTDAEGFASALGTADADSIRALLEQIVQTIPNGGSRDLTLPVNHALATLHDIAPKDALEGLLAVQMFGVHQAAMAFLARAGFDGQTHVNVDANVNRANKLLRTFTMQMEALNRHRGKVSSQTVVGNVNVNQGGQAIVGSVNHPGPGKISKEDDKEKKAG